MRECHYGGTGSKSEPSWVKDNPVCCVWVEITNWTPNPGVAGYVIVNQPGGRIISASDLAQLRAAVQRFQQTIRKNGNSVEVLLGLLRNDALAGVAGG
jgi:hypothetical protein